MAVTPWPHCLFCIILLAFGEVAIKQLYWDNTVLPQAGETLPFFSTREGDKNLRSSSRI